MFIYIYIYIYIYICIYIYIIVGIFTHKELTTVVHCYAIPVSDLYIFKPAPTDYTFKHDVNFM